MKDSVMTTTGKTILAVICGVVLGRLLSGLLILISAWFLGMGILKFLFIGNFIAMPLGMLINYGCLFLGGLFKNKVAGAVFGILISVFIVVAIVVLWAALDDATDKMWFKCANISLVLGITAVITAISSFCHED
jgi:hypothetical protein